MKLTPVLPLALALAAAVLTACDEGSDAQTTVIGTTAIYSPATGDIPIPNDLLYSGTTDATLNFPPSSDPATQSVQNALGSLDGWSTGAPIQVPFSAALDPATLIPGDTVRFFEVTRLTTATLPVGGPVTSVVGELTGTTLDAGGLPVNPAANYVVTPDPTGTTIVLLPLRPLDPATSYMINVTDGITDAAGDPVIRSIIYQLAAETPQEGGEENASLDGLRTVVQAMHTAAGTQGIDPDTILVSVQFTTQSIGGVLATVAAIVAGAEQAVIDGLCAGNPALDCTDTTPSPFSTPSAGTTWTFVGDTGSLAGSPANDADVYQGSITLPYYLAGIPGGSAATDLADDQDPANFAPLTVPWSSRYAFGTEDLDGDEMTAPTPANNLTAFNPLPAATEQETVPVLLTVPKTVTPPNGFPIVVFQHGVTSNRTVVLGIADALAAQGFACVSMDLPLHGLDPTSPLFTSYQDGGTRERTFGLDLTDNLTGAPGSDGNADASGTHYINLSSLRLNRDNVRQGAADLLALFAVLDEIDFDGGGPDLDAVALNENIHFVGHSFGAIVGTIALTQLPQVTSATLGMPGGQLPYLLQASESFGDLIEAGLVGASGLTPGTPEFAAFQAQFLFSAQTVVDDADPINYGAALATVGTPIHLIEVIGETGVSDPDQVIPNAVATAPLAGTEPLVRALQLDSVDADIPSEPGGIRGVVRFTRGDHSSLLLVGTTLDGAAAFAEMQAQTAEFAVNDGEVLNLGDESVVQTAP